MQDRNQSEIGYSKYLSLYVTENPRELEDCCREYWKPDNHDETLGEISRKRFSVSESLSQIYDGLTERSQKWQKECDYLIKFQLKILSVPKSI